MPYTFWKNFLSHWQENTQKTEDSVLMLNSYKPRRPLGTWEFIRVKDKVCRYMCVSSCESFSHEQHKKRAWRDSLGTNQGKKSWDTWILTLVWLMPFHIEPRSSTILGELGMTPKAERHQAGRPSLPLTCVHAWIHQESRCTELPMWR